MILLQKPKKCDFHYLVAIVAGSIGLITASSGGATLSTQPPAPVVSFNLVTVSEQEGLKMLLKQIDAAGGEKVATLAVLDKALAKLGRPTKLRGVVQFMRAKALDGSQEANMAMAAIVESVRLLPDHSAPLIAASEIYTFSGEPGIAADYLIRATQKDPAAARQIDAYEIDALIGRLESANDHRRVGKVSDTLLNIGWVGRDLTSGSSLARDAIKRRMSEGDVEGARALIPKLIVPADSRALLSLRAYQALWPDLEAWGGPKLRRQWKVYLDEARARWIASSSADSTRDYVAALAEARHDQTLIREILPILSEVADEDHFGMVFVVAPLARALVRQNQLDQAREMLDAAEKVWPLGSEANALNITLTRARVLLNTDRPAEALTMSEKALAEAKKWGEQINGSAVSAMHAYRACALHELGRTADAAESITITLTGGPILATEVYLCLDDVSAARQVLLNALKRPGQREDVIRYLQLDEPDYGSGKYSLKTRARLEELKKDSTLASELSKYGRVLPYELREGAPLEMSVTPL